MRTTVLPKKKPPKTSPPNFSNWQAKRAYENPFVKISSNTNIFYPEKSPYQILSLVLFEAIYFQIFHEQPNVPH